MSRDDERSFSEAEVDVILREAIERQGGRSNGALSRGDLHELARQLHVDPAHVDAAIATLDSKRGEREAVEAIGARRRRGLRAHVVSFLLVGAFLVALNALLPGPWWAQFPLLAWALGLAFHAWGALQAPSPRAVARHVERQRAAEEKARRKEARDAMRRDMKVIGSAVEEGVREVIGGVRRAIEQGAPAPRAADDARTGVRVDVQDEHRREPADAREAERSAPASRAERKG